MSQLNNNTTALQEILATVNALPEAGGSGGSVETCTVTLTIAPGSTSTIPAYCATCYVGANKTPTYANMNNNPTSVPITDSYTVCKDSLCAVSTPGKQVNNSSGTAIMTTGACQVPTGFMDVAIYAGIVPIYVTGDCEITITI